MYNDEEVPKYRKKKSGKSKSSRKSSHKHLYEDCLIVDKTGHPEKAQFCTICGKLAKVQWFVNLPDDAVFEMCKALRRFEIEDFFQDYVSISELNEEISDVIKFKGDVHDA